MLQPNGKPTVRVKIPIMLRARSEGLAVVEGRGWTLRELFADLEETYPGFAEGIVTKQGSVHRFVNLYVNDEDARYIGSLDARVEDGDTVSILPAVAGGQARA